MNGPPVYLVTFCFNFIASFCPSVRVFGRFKKSCGVMRKDLGALHHSTSAYVHRKKKHSGTEHSPLLACVVFFFFTCPRAKTPSSMSESGKMGIALGDLCLNPLH